MTNCYECDREVDLLSPRSRCVVCEHRRAIFNEQQNEAARDSICLLEDDLQHVENLFISHCIDYDMNKLKESLDSLLEFVSTIARDPSVCREANELEVINKATGAYNAIIWALNGYSTAPPSQFHNIAEYYSNKLKETK